MTAKYVVKDVTHEAHTENHDENSTDEEYIVEYVGTEVYRTPSIMAAQKFAARMEANLKRIYTQ